MGHAYRSGYEQIIGSHIVAWKRSHQELSQHLPSLRAVFSARVARIIGGAVGIFGALLMAVIAASDDGGAAAWALVLSVIAAIGSWLSARLALGLISRLGRGLRIEGKLPALSGVLADDLSRLDESDAREQIDRDLGRLELWSTSLPLIATSLLAPLSIHFCAAPLFGPHYDFMRSYAGWIRISLVVVGHAHLALAFMAHRFAKKMRSKSPTDLREMPLTGEWGRALGIAVLVAAIPGILLLVVPPVLSAITGILFIPFMFVLMHHNLTHERSAIEMATTMATVSSVRVTPEDVDSALLEDQESWTTSEPQARWSAG